MISYFFILYVNISIFLFLITSFPNLGNNLSTLTYFDVSAVRQLVHPFSDFFTWCSHFLWSKHTTGRMVAGRKEHWPSQPNRNDTKNDPTTIMVYITAYWLVRIDHKIGYTIILFGEINLDRWFSFLNLSWLQILNSWWIIEKMSTMIKNSIYHLKSYNFIFFRVEDNKIIKKINLSLRHFRSFFPSNSNYGVVHSSVRHDFLLSRCGPLILLVKFHHTFISLWSGDQL